TSCGLARSKTSTASLAFPASPTTVTSGSRPRSSRTPSRASGSSSTTAARMGSGIGQRFLVEGDAHHGKRSSLGMVFEREAVLVGVEDGQASAYVLEPHSASALRRRRQ